jgi:hypothetical protein
VGKGLERAFTPVFGGAWCIAGTFALQKSEREPVCPSTFTARRNSDNESVDEMGCAGNRVREICAEIVSAESRTAGAGLTGSAVT